MREYTSADVVAFFLNDILNTVLYYAEDFYRCELFSEQGTCYYGSEEGDSYDRLHGHTYPNWNCTYLKQAMNEVIQLAKDYELTGSNEWLDAVRHHFERACSPDWTRDELPF